MDVTWDKVEEFLDGHEAMTLATCCADQPWATTVFYARRELVFYFFSALDARHSSNIQRNPRVAAAVSEAGQGWQRIKGIQMEGIAERVPILELPVAIAVYLRKFPFVASLLAVPSRMGQSLPAAASRMGQSLPAAASRIGQSLLAAPPLEQSLPAGCPPAGESPPSMSPPAAPPPTVPPPTAEQEPALRETQEFRVGAKVFRARLYRFCPDRLFYLDNEIGFGRRTELAIPSRYRRQT